MDDEKEEVREKEGKVVAVRRREENEKIGGKLTKMREIGRDKCEREREDREIV